MSTSPHAESGDVAVLIPAAGGGQRFGGDKLALVIAGRTVLEHSVRAFIDRPDVLVVVVIRDGLPPLPRELMDHPKYRQCPGGESRAESVRRGLARLLQEPWQPPLLAVHDAARPAVSGELIDRVFAAARAHGAAVPGVPVTDTIKRVGADRNVADTPPRGELVAVQTPQAMRLAWLTDALARSRVPLSQVTDDVQLLEFAGYPVRVVEGETSNLKLTRRGDAEGVERALATPNPAR